MPNTDVTPDKQPSYEKELELSKQAARDAAKSASEAILESEKLHREIEALRNDIKSLSTLASTCSDLAKRSEARRLSAIAKAKKEAEEKKVQEEVAAAAAALPSPTPLKGEYSKSDAPPGYYPEPKAPLINDKQ